MAIGEPALVKRLLGLEHDASVSQTYILILVVSRVIIKLHITALVERLADLDASHPGIGLFIIVVVEVNHTGPHLSCSAPVVDDFMQPGRRLVDWVERCLFVIANRVKFQSRVG